MSKEKQPSKITTPSTNKSTTKIVAKEEKNMKKATKQTTKKTTTVSKEVDTKNLVKGVADIAEVVNHHICNINKKKHSSVELYTLEEVTDYVKANKLTKLATQLGTLHNTLINNALEANYLKYLEKKDNERKYIKDEDDNKDTATKHEERLQDEFDSMKKEIAKLTKLVSQAIKKGE